MSDGDSAIQEPIRCGWVSSHPLYQEYHDTQWGRPALDDRELFAKLCLDGQQAGLSWFTILQKQKNWPLISYSATTANVSLDTSIADMAMAMGMEGKIGFHKKRKDFFNAVFTNMSILF